MDDLRKGLWSELSWGRSIDVYRRSLQRAHIERLEYLLTGSAPSISPALAARIGPAITASQSDIRPAARAELKILQRQISTAISRTADRSSKIHLEDCLARIKDVLDKD